MPVSTPTPPVMSSSTAKSSRFRPAAVVFLLVLLLALSGILFVWFDVPSRLAMISGPSVTPSPGSASPTSSEWKTYTNDTYKLSLLYPPEAQVEELSPEGEGATSQTIRVLFIGATPQALDQTQSSVPDGYVFSIVERGTVTTTSVDTAISQMKETMKSACPSQISQVVFSEISDTTIASKSAKTYSMTGCFGDVTDYAVSNGSYIFGITQISGGDTSLQATYRQTLDKMLSSLQFTE